MKTTQLPLLPLVAENISDGLRLALEQEGIPVRVYKPGRADGAMVLFDSHRGARPPLAEGQQAIDVHRLRSGFDADPFAELLDERASQHRWQIGPYTVCEVIARVDKCDLRRKLLLRLRNQVEAAGGIWLRVGACPFPYRSAFNFRLDHDDYQPNDFATVLDTIAGHEQAFSHYLCAATHAQQPEVLARLQGQDVGSHGYHHHTYQRADENRKNIARGIEALRQAGIEPVGFVSPLGRFTPGLLEVLEELGVAHSSEFGLAYDDWPLFPRGSRVLQIPVHPVCLGTFLDTLESDTARPLDAVVASLAANYLVQLARARYEAGEPIFLYGHPDRRLGRHPRVLTEVLAAVGRLGSVWRTSRTQFAAWWRARRRMQVRVYRDRDSFVVLAEGLPREYRPAMEYWRGEHVAVMPVDRPMIRFAPGALAYETRRHRPIVRGVRIDAGQGLRGTVRRYLDWERVTPVEEIETRTLRGWLKKTLRRAKA